MTKSELQSVISTIVKEEMYKVLPELIKEVLQESLSGIPKLATPKKVVPVQRPKFNSSGLRELMGYGDISPINESKTEMVITSEYQNMDPIPVSSIDPSVAKALTRDYSSLMGVLNKK